MQDRAVQVRILVRNSVDAPAASAIRVFILEPYRRHVIVRDSRSD
jgi:hypothetical protein